jgi:hypothetical protein
MKLLLKNEDDLNANLPFNTGADWLFLKSYMQEAQDEFLNPVISEAEFELLEESIASAEIGNVEFKELEKRAKKALSLLGYLKALPHMNINIRQGGFTVNADDRTQPASQSRVNELRDQLGRSAQLHLDNVISYLDEKSDVFTQYRDSGIPQRRFANFINQAPEWNKSVQHKLGEWLIDQIRPTLDTVEEMLIRPIISDAFFDDLRNKIKNREDVSAYSKAIGMIQRIVANQSLSDLLVLNSVDLTPSQGVFLVWREQNTTSRSRATAFSEKEQMSKMLLDVSSQWQTKLKQELDSNPSLYTLYAASDLYNSTGVIQPEASSEGGIYPGFGLHV